MPLLIDKKKHIESISIVICTYNRAKILKETLESYLTLCRPIEFKIELLIVDNNSNDETLQMVDQFMQYHPEVRYVFEPEPGLSYARNTGVKESRGDIIIYVDDDVYFDSNWLVEVGRIFKEYPDASCMGGRIIPVFETGKPDWITDDLLTPYGLTNSGDIIKWMLYPEYPFGGNMAFKRTVFDKIDMFNPNLGRKKKNLLSNEENEIFWRVSQAGLRVIYNPMALLYHRIPSERTCKEWLLARYYWQGISSIVFDQLIAPQSRLVLLKRSIRDGWLLLRQSTGMLWLPRKAYWHYKATKFPEKCSQSYKLGIVKQMFIESISFKKN